MWFISVEVEKETSAPPPKKKPGSAAVMRLLVRNVLQKNCAKNILI